MTITANLSLAPEALPHLDQLSKNSGQSASACVLDGAEIIYIARSSQRRVMPTNLSPGRMLPAYCTSMGHVLLATLSDEEARVTMSRSALTANTLDTKTGMAELLAEFELDERGQTVAAINIGAGRACTGVRTGRAVSFHVERDTAHSTPSSAVITNLRRNFIMLMARIAFSDPNKGPEREQFLEAHKAHLRTAAITILKSGPFRGIDGNLAGALVLADVSSAREMSEFSATDPFVTAGVYSRVDLVEWTVTISA